MARTANEQGIRNGVDTVQAAVHTAPRMRDGVRHTARGTTDRSAQATERVVEHLRTLIDSGRLRPGDRLAPERELATQLGVSRPSVRTALRTLSAMRVIESRHGAGTFIPAGPPALGTDSLRFIASLHRFDWAAMFEARRVLEASIAALAAQRATGEDLAVMAEHLAGMFSAIDDPQEFTAHDEGFHSAVARACHNPILSLLAQKVATIALERRRATAHRGSDWKTSAERHRQIYLAIRAHDADRAHEAMAHHLNVAGQIIADEEAAASGRSGQSAASKRVSGSSRRPARKACKSGNGRARGS